MTITRPDLVKVVMQESTLAHDDAKDFIDQFFEVMIQSLEVGSGIKVSKFGNFILRDKAPRIGRNPRTKIEHEIKARRVVSFRAGSSLKELLKAKDAS